MLWKRTSLISTKRLEYLEYFHSLAWRPASEGGQSGSNIINRPLLSVCLSWLSSQILLHTIGKVSSCVVLFLGSSGGGEPAPTLCHFISDAMQCCPLNATCFVPPRLLFDAFHHSLSNPVIHDPSYSKSWHDSAHTSNTSSQPVSRYSLGPHPPADTSPRRSVIKIQPQ